MKHLHAILLTANHPRANNRGETEGSISTLQKLVVSGAIHTTVSAEAIRAGLRRTWVDMEAGLSKESKWKQYCETNRHEAEGKVGAYFPIREKDKFDAARYIDDDVLGFLQAKQGNDRQGRRGRFEVARAISLRPFLGEMIFAARAPQGPRDSPTPYSQEVHVTEMQWGFSFTPGKKGDGGSHSVLAKPERAALVLAGLHSLSRVAGNHAKFLSGFDPVAVLFRWTDDPAPRILYGFSLDGEKPSLAPIEKLLGLGELEASELVWGANIDVASVPEGLGRGGVTQAFRRVWAQMHRDLAFDPDFEALPLLSAASSGAG